MRASFYMLLSMGLAGLASTASATMLSNFLLFDHEGKAHELRKQSTQKAVLLISTHADDPLFGQYADWLAPLQNDAMPVTIWFVAGEAHGERGAFQAHYAANESLPPTLIDDAQVVLRMLGTENTGQAYLVDAASWRVVHEAPLSEVFVSAAAAWLEGTEEPFAALAADGPLERQPLSLRDWPEEITYTEHIAPIVAQKCATCHRRGEVGPFAFDSYRRAAGWAAMIREVVLTKRMPPWDADPLQDHFGNERGLTPEETRLLTAWIESGTPRGEGDDILADIPDADPEAWRLGEPDLVLTMGDPFEIPADGVLEYQLFRVPSELTEDKWIKGLEVRPGNRRVLHHALIFIEYPEHLKHMEPQVSGGARGFFAGFVPGAEPRFFPENTGKYVPAGATFIFQMHYVTTGREEVDQTSMALHFLDEKPNLQLETVAAFNAEFEIPPYESDYIVEAERRIGGVYRLYSMSPHMHYRGKRFQYVAEYPSGETEILLSVPRYQFDWQINYAFETPKTLPPGTVIRCEGAFDNSPQNPYNPDPSKPVRFGDQTYEEMFIGYMDMAAPPQYFERQAEARKERLARARNEREIVADGPDMSLDDLIGTKWKEGDWQFEFLADDVFLVNGLIRGKYRMEDGRVYIDVVGEHFELDVIGSGLYFNRTHAIDRIE